MSHAPRHEPRHLRQLAHGDPTQRHLVYRRDGHVWLFRWDGGHENDLVAALNLMAREPHDAFDTVDASVVAHCLGQTSASDASPDHPACS